MEITIRPATEADIEGILDIVNGYAAQNLMLPRTDEQIRRVLRWFLVAEDQGQIVGCGSNVELTPQADRAALPRRRTGVSQHRIGQAPCRSADRQGSQRRL